MDGSDHEEFKDFLRRRIVTNRLVGGGSDRHGLNRRHPIGLRWNIGRAILPRDT